MKVQKKELTPFLKPEMVKDGDTVEILDEGTIRESKFGKDRVVVTVKLPNGETALWSLNQTTLNALIQGYGDETKNWVGKKVKVTIATTFIAGQRKTVVYGEPA